MTPVPAPASLAVALSMCREANTEAKLPTPMCWDLALYVERLERALGGSASAAPSAEAIALEKDALRYRWLRRFDHFAQVDAMLDTTNYNTLDAAVDAAMAQE